MFVSRRQHQIVAMACHQATGLSLLKLLLSLITLLICAFSFLIGEAAADIVPSNSAIVGFVQSLQDPRYKIQFHPPGTSFQKLQQDPDQEIIVMTDGEKRKYECVLPKRAERDSFKGESSQQNSSSISLTTDRRISKTPDDLLAILKDPCFYRHEGWWTYEFCYHVKVRQIHIENKKVIQEFVLGVYDADVTADLHKNLTDVSLQKDHRSKSAAQRYHSHIYTNGTLCDLTGEPRETEVRFVCADTGNNMINSITESSTCKYTLIFHAPVLCKHLLFQEERPRSLVINCVEMPHIPEKVVDKDEGDDDVISGLLSSEVLEKQ